MRFALAHNGNLTNVRELKQKLVRKKCETSMDSELIVRLLEESEGEFEEALASVLPLLRGSYSLAILLPDRMIVARDPSGNRPLSIGKKQRQVFVASETVAFANVGAHDVCEMPAGSYAVITNEGIEFVQFAKPNLHQCEFEKIYYAHPSSVVFGESMSTFRDRLGIALEKTHPAQDADIVTGVPDSAILIAQGYARSGRSGSYHQVIFRNHYVGRTFIAATQALRDYEVDNKFNWSAADIKGKHIVLIDDSIVRGTTSPKVVQRLKFLGARKVHMRIASPPIKYPCTYGINTPRRKELLAGDMNVEDMREYIGADSLAFLPLDVLKALSPNPNSFCFACMDGKYWDRE